MQSPLQIVFRDLPVSEDIERACEKEVQKLERFHSRITSCRVVITQPHQRHKKGNLYQVRIDMALPGHDVVVHREPPQRKVREKVEIAIREAFDTARRRLEDVARKDRREVKHHEVESLAQVVRLFPSSGYGFIETSEGREVYFHANSVLDARFEDLEIGTEVAFHEEQGEQGPQASSVRLKGLRAGPVPSASEPVG